MQPARAPGEHGLDHARQHHDDRRLEVRLLPEHRVPVQRQRLPDVRHRHQGRLVEHGRRARCGRSCTAAAPATSTRRATRSRAPARRSRSRATSLATQLDEQRAARQASATTPPAFRTLAVSYCSHDIYAGANSPDPHNPNTTPDGKPRTDERRARDQGRDPVRAGPLPDDEDVPARRQRRLGRHVRGRVVDAAAGHRARRRRRRREHRERRGVRRRRRRRASAPTTTTPRVSSAIAARVHPDLANIDNEPDKLVSSGRLTVPLLHIWNHGDANTCGSPPIACPLRDGSHVTMGCTDCIHEPMRAAIAAQGPTSRSKNLPVCVDDDADAGLFAARRHQQGRPDEHRPVDARRLPRRHHELGPRAARRRADAAPQPAWCTRITDMYTRRLAVSGQNVCCANTGVALASAVVLCRESRPSTDPGELRRSSARRSRRRQLRAGIRLHREMA